MSELEAMGRALDEALRVGEEPPSRLAIVAWEEVRDAAYALAEAAVEEHHNRVFGTVQRGSMFKQQTLAELTRLKEAQHE